MTNEDNKILRFSPKAADFLNLRGFKIPAKKEVTLNLEDQRKIAVTVATDLVSKSLNKSTKAVVRSILRQVDPIDALFDNNVPFKHSLDAPLVLSQQSHSSKKLPYFQASLL